MSQSRQLAAIMFTDIAKIYDKEYFQSQAHQNILKKMGFVK